MSKKNLLMLMADTGGGHRSSCEAVIEALSQKYSDAFDITMLDLPKKYLKFPFNQLNPTYPYLLGLGSYPWEVGFEITNSPFFIPSLIRLFWPVLRSGVHQALRDHPADLVVSFHPLFNYPLITARRELQVVSPVATVVTDLVGGHGSWYIPGFNRYILPTPQAEKVAISWGLPPEKLAVIGQPISLRFHRILSQTPAILRSQLGLNPSLTTVLVMGGGQGLGKISQLSHALAASSLKLQLIIVTGRNPSLQRKLSAHSWPVPVKIFGFTKDIPSLMRASDFIVTKGGPSSICEALTCRIPIFISDYIHGQETGNMHWLVDNNVGFYTPTSGQILNIINYFISYPRQLEKYQHYAAAVSRPLAALDIAQSLVSLIDSRPSVPSHVGKLIA